MSLSNIKKMKGERGFTIVELLIVIVVIAVLAAIVFVAYQGITNNAKNSNYKSNAASIQKVAEVYYTEEGEYPDTSGEFTTGSATTKLPAGLSVNIIAVGTPPDSNDDLAEAAETGTYTVRACTTEGLRIYYPVLGGSTQVINVGDTSTCGT